MNKKKLKVIYAFNSKVTDWLGRLDQACDLVFKKMTEEYEEKNKKHEQQYI